MGLLVHRHNPIEDLRAKIQPMNDQAISLTNPIEQQKKYVKIQYANDKMDSLHEALTTTKKTLWEFRPLSQTSYLFLYHMDSFVNAECHTIEQQNLATLDSEKAHKFIIDCELIDEKVEISCG